MADGERIVVAVHKSITSKEAVKWTISNKITKPEDTLILLHVVSTVPSPMGMEIYQSKLNSQILGRFIRDNVLPMMMGFKTIVDPSIKLELKVARNDDVRKGIVEEAIKLNASVLCLGTSGKSTLFGSRNRGMSSTCQYCLKKSPVGLRVYVLQQGKMLMSTETMPQSASPSSMSSSGTPSGSGGLSASIPQSDSRRLPKLASAQRVGGSGSSSDLSESHSSFDSSYLTQEQQEPSRRSRFGESSSEGPVSHGRSAYQHSLSTSVVFPNASKGKGSQRGQASMHHNRIVSADGDGLRSTPDSTVVLSSAVSDIDKWAKEIQDRSQGSSMADIGHDSSPLPRSGYHSDMSMSMSSGAHIEELMLRELASMRMKVVDEEKAHTNINRRAGHLMAVASVSISEGVSQSRRASRDRAPQMSAENWSEGHGDLIGDPTLYSGELLRRYMDEQTRTELRHSISKSFGRSFQLYTWAEATAATDNWREEWKVGEGGFGTVYKGTLNHTPVAIKILKNSDSLQAANDFRQEVEVLGQIQHPHIVMLLGCCAEKYALVYEYMANGSLEDRLACKDRTPPIPWFVRLRVMAEVASALVALHTRQVPIVHRDIKPANILLTKNFVAKLGDVGLAKFMPGLNDMFTYMQDSKPVGTFAYVDPEFQRTGEFGPKSDVYSLGIVMLDLLIGHKPSLHEYVEEVIESSDKDRFCTLLDSSAGEWPVGLAMEVATLAVKCSEMRRRKRPCLEKEVMPVLNRAREMAVAAEERLQVGRRHGFGDAPSSLFCPITEALMTEPVLASDGHTYELLAIQQWLTTNDCSPVTGNKLVNKFLVPNHAVKSMIQEWKK